jgi:RNA polymerase sigma-70 factor (ECF subfamily)
MSRASPTAAPAPAGDVPGLVEHLFRRESGRMLATLTRIFGLEHLELAEDVVQEALIQALRHWPVSGVPANPSAWLVQVAKRRALDVVRREQGLAARQADVRAALEGDEALAPDEAALAAASGDLSDDQLRMIFMCCHPDVPLEGRVALTLKLVGGFGVAEIARAFLADEGAIFQRLVRAKRRIRESGVPFEEPESTALGERLDAVLEVLYLMFNEGHTATEGEALLRHDLCGEAIRLASLLTANAVTAEPRTHALLALFLFHGARLDSRVDERGELVLLSEQDRSRWDRGMIERGLAHLSRAASGSVLTAFHLEAEIASCHATAARYQDTDWPRIVWAYDALLGMQRSPLVALNRAVAMAELSGPAVGLSELEALRNEDSLGRYYLLPAARGELLRRLGDGVAASEAFREARALARTEPVRRFLERRLESLGEGTVESGSHRPSRGERGRWRGAHSPPQE